MNYCEHPECRELALLHLEYIAAVTSKQIADDVRAAITTGFVRCQAATPRPGIHGTGCHAPFAERSHE